MDSTAPFEFFRWFKPFKYGSNRVPSDAVKSMMMGNISRWHYKRASDPVGIFSLIVGYLLTIVSQICRYCEFHYVDALSILSPLAAALHVVDWILNFLFLHCRYLGALVYSFISSRHWYLEDLSYIKKQQQQAEAQNKQYHQSSNSGRLF